MESYSMNQSQAPQPSKKRDRPSNELEEQATAFYISQIRLLQNLVDNSNATFHQLQELSRNQAQIATILLECINRLNKFT